MTESRDYRSVVIIGAPRSGTNMLRDWLASTPSIATWPCDEINYIWRHRNLTYPSDAFKPDMATSAVQRYIQRKFAWVAKHYGTDIVLEKTCANSLRVPFVEKALIAPRYIFIYRNGFDAVASALHRWRAPLDPLYVMRKARFVPLLDLPYYGLRYARARAYRWISSERRIAVWGPVLPGMQSLLRENDLAQICALQWRACIENSLAGFEAVPEERILRVAYEDLVRNKLSHAEELADFIEIPLRELERSAYLARITAKSIGKGEDQLDSGTKERVQKIIGPQMRELGYQ